MKFNFEKLIFNSAVGASIFLPYISMSQTLMPFAVEGKLGRYSAYSMAYLTYVGPTGLQTDSVDIQNGAFSFSGKIKCPRKATLTIKGSEIIIGEEENKVIFLEEKTVRIGGARSLINTHVDGGNANAELLMLEKKLRSNTEKKEALDKRRAATPEEKGNESRAMVKTKMEDIYAEMKRIKLQFVGEHPDSWVSLITIQEYEQMGADLDEFAVLFNALNPKIKNSTIGADLSGKIEAAKKTGIGKMAPDFILPDTAGVNRSPADFRGQYVLIDFWASWCKPCREENPSVVLAHRQYAAKGFTVIGVSLDDSSSSKLWINAIHQDHLNWTQLSDLKGWRSDAAVLYAVTAIPQNFLLAPDGTIVAKGLQGEALLGKLQELFGKNK